MADPKEIYGVIDGYGAKVIEIQKALTRCIALGPENGGHGEHEKTELIQRLLMDLKPDKIELVKAPDKRAKEGFRPNLVAEWEGVYQDTPKLWILCHTDVVPPGDLSLWEGDPYDVWVEGDKIFGRGVEDNHHGFVSPYLALKAILDSGNRPLRNIGIVAVADEETGSRYGLQYLLREKPSLFSKNDLIIVPDGGDETGTMIEVAEKSMLWVKFIVKGKQCHASTPHKGKNSLVAAAKLIISLGKLKEIFAHEDELFSPPASTFEPTKMEPNVPNVNTIPGREIFYMDCRILPRYHVDDILSACGELAKDVASQLGVEITVEVAHREDSAPSTPADAPVVRALAAAIKRITGREARPKGIGGGTVAAFFRKAGLPAVVWLTCPDTAHQPNEYCNISDILIDSKVFACLFLRDETSEMEESISAQDV